MVGMSMKQTYTTEYTTRRLPSSVNGNPRYELVTPDGLIIGNTRPDSSLAYGGVPNNADAGVCKIVVHVTPSGRRYIESVKRVS